MRVPAHRDVATPFDSLNKRFCRWEKKQLAANDSNELVFRCHSGLLLRLDKKLSTWPHVGLVVDQGVGSLALSEDVDHPAELR